MNIKSWLRRVPHPVTLRLDDKKVLRISEGKNKWRDIVDAIALEQPAKLEALDADGNVIRVTQLADPDSPADEAAAAKPKSELAELGALIAGAYKSGAEQHAAAFQLAFAENTKLVQVLAERLGGLEKAWQTTLEQRAAEYMQQGGGGDGIDGLMTGPMGPLLQALAMKTLGGAEKPAAAAPHANGVKKAK
jgi:hypothetical protein